mmetsp:Transcript_25306/g.72871  ORF Transcript_25306/g.72871 Transcript_25306/m.72871 type:complete len:373 (-) Transcript_25306:46-1164(-)
MLPKLSATLAGGRLETCDCCCRPPEVERSGGAVVRRCDGDCGCVVKSGGGGCIIARAAGSSCRPPSRPPGEPPKPVQRSSKSSLTPGVRPMKCPGGSPTMSPPPGLGIGGGPSIAGSAPLRRKSMLARWVAILLACTKSVHGMAKDIGKGGGGGGGGARSEEVEDFIKNNEVDESAADMLRSASPTVQRTVLSRGELKTARNPSSALLSRIRDAKSGGGDRDRDRGPDGGMPPPPGGMPPIGMPGYGYGYGMYPGAYPGYPGYPGYPMAPQADSRGYSGAAAGTMPQAGGAYGAYPGACGAYGAYAQYYNMGQAGAYGAAQPPAQQAAITQGEPTAAAGGGRRRSRSRNRSSSSSYSPSPSPTRKRRRRGRK